MDNRLNLVELAEKLAARCDLSSRESETFVRSFFEQIAQGLRYDQLVKVKGFGVFKLVDVNARESVNVNTGERFEIAGHTKVTFTPDASLRDAVNRPFAEFETVLLNDATDVSEMEAGVPADSADEDVEEEVVQEKEIVKDNPQPQQEEVAPVVETAENTVVEEKKEAEIPVAEIAKVEEPKKSSNSRTIFLIIAAICLFALGYCVGYFSRPTEQKNETVEQQATVNEPTPETKAKKATSTASVAKKKDEPIVNTYPQVENGEYIIVGEIARDTMVAGATLTNFSVKYYNDKYLVKYICKMNGITNPDIIPLNKELIIPKLQKKEETTTQD